MDRNREETMKPAARCQPKWERVVPSKKTTAGNPHIGPQLQRVGLRGSRNPSATIDEATVKRIWQVRAAHPKWGPKRLKAALEREGLTASESAIHDILQRKTWSWMAPEA